MKDNRIYPSNEDIFNNELSESIVMQINQANMNEQEFFFENDIPPASNNSSNRETNIVVDIIKKSENKVEKEKKMSYLSRKK